MGYGVVVQCVGVKHWSVDERCVVGLEYMRYMIFQSKHASIAIWPSVVTAFSAQQILLPAARACAW